MENFNYSVPQTTVDQYQCDSKVDLWEELVGAYFAVEKAKLKSFGKRDKFHIKGIAE